MRETLGALETTYTFRFASPPAQLVDAFRKYYGPTMNAFQAAETTGRSSELKTELDDLFKSQNRSAVADATVIPRDLPASHRFALSWAERPRTAGRLRSRARTGNGRRRQ